MQPCALCLKSEQMDQGEYVTSDGKNGRMLDVIVASGKIIKIK